MNPSCGCTFLGFITKSHIHGQEFHIIVQFRIFFGKVPSESHGLTDVLFLGSIVDFDLDGTVLQSILSVKE